MRHQLLFLAGELGIDTFAPLAVLADSRYIRIPANDPSRCV